MANAAWVQRSHDIWMQPRFSDANGNSRTPSKLGAWLMGVQRLEEKHQRDTYRELYRMAPKDAVPPQWSRRAGSPLGSSHLPSPELGRPTAGGKALPPRAA